MKSSFLVRFSSLALLVLSACSSLSSGGARVRYYTKAEPPRECRYIEDVSAGTGFSLFSQQAVKNSLRNQTAEAGGNFLVIDDIIAVPNADGGAGGYAGTGRAMWCPEQIN